MKLALLLLLVGVLCSSSFVYAVSLPISPDLRSDVRVGSSSVSRDFVVVGDVNVNDIVFFVRPLVPGFLLVNGVSEFRVSSVLDPYQRKVFSVVFDGVDNIENLDVEYGVSFSRVGSGDVFDFKQVISSSFVVDVRCGSCGVVPVVPVSSGSAGSVSSSGQVVRGVDFDSSGDVSVGDVSPGGSSLTTGVVDSGSGSGSGGFGFGLSESGLFDGSSRPGGRGLALVFLSLLFLTLGVNYVVILRLREVDV
jgi:hypothetical protein